MPRSSPKQISIPSHFPTELLLGSRDISWNCTSQGDKSSIMINTKWIFFTFQYTDRASHCKKHDSCKTCMFTLVLAGGRPSSYFLFFLIAFFLPPVLRLLCQESREIPVI